MWGHGGRYLKICRLCLPDIMVFDDTGLIVCCVEIGYTRRAKLKKYNELGISDVRWYSKDGDLIESRLTRTREVVVREVRLTFPEIAYCCLPQFLGTERVSTELKRLKKSSPMVRGTTVKTALQSNRRSRSKKEFNDHTC